MKIYTILLLFAFTIISCSDDIVVKNTQRNVFHSFWQIMNNQYVFFEEKRLNWDSIYNAYDSKITDQTPDSVLVASLQNIINYVGDQHVSVYIPQKKLICFNDTSYFNYIGSIESNQRYGKANLKMNSIIEFAQLPNDLLYFRIRTFAFDNEKVVLDWIKSTIQNYKYGNGVVLDVRNNGGGSEFLSFSALFYNGLRELYRIKYRVSGDRTQFTDLITKSYKGSGLISQNTPIAMITNGRTYSMGNLFAFIMKTLPNCTTFGQKSGGGGGMVFNYYLPNNWILQVTNSKAYSLNGELMEYGLQPDIEVIPTKEFWENTYPVTGEDPQLEAALQFLNTK